jgi:predicted AAA+ superfamily ATPase
MQLKPEVVAQLERVLASVEQLLPPAVGVIDWAEVRAANWRCHSFSGCLEPIAEIDKISLDDLLGIERQKKILTENTLQFIKGYPANNVLLWGSKSSLVRALLNNYADQGLRIIQVDKNDLNHLSDIFVQIGEQPYRFIILCDDLSFEPGDPGYKVLKSVLDGSVYASPENVLIYVTSNRRHLLPEYFKDNLGSKMVEGEIHHGESVEEKISLSDRFGLWVSFRVLKQERYLEVVKKTVARICREHGLEPLWDDELSRAAIKWSHEKSKRCGRTALQFSRYWVGQYMLARSEQDSYSA